MDQESRKYEIEELTTEYLKRKLLQETTPEWFKKMREKSENKINEEEPIEKLKDIQFAYKKWIKDDLEFLIWKYLVEDLANATDTERRIFLQGTLNGIKVVQEEMENQCSRAEPENEEESAVDIDTSL